MTSLSGGAACAINNFLFTACDRILWASSNVGRSLSPRKADDAFSGVTVVLSDSPASRTLTLIAPVHEGKIGDAFRQSWIACLVSGVRRCYHLS
jgi:hypothetical protein